MIETLKKFGGKKLGGLILIAVIIVAFGFGGFGGGFSTNNQNNIVKINKTNVTTQDFMNYLNQSGISQQAIRENLDNNIIEELLSGLISTTLIDLEVEDFNLSITELTVLKKIKENKNFHDENDVFQRTKYEKFLLSNNMSAPMFELQLKNRELQKHLFDFIGAGTITPDFLSKKKFEDENKSLNLEYFAMENLYKKKENFTDNEINKFLEDNKDDKKLHKFINLFDPSYIDLKESIKFIKEIPLNSTQEINSHAVDLLNLFALVAVGFTWLEFIHVSIIKTEDQDDDFYLAKIQLGEFYLTKVILETQKFKNNIISSGKLYNEFQDKYFELGI